jgi:chorismate mutase/prephenate dehydratase
MGLDELRQAIDDADREILSALKRRAVAAQAIGREKAESGRAAFAPDREAEVFRRVRGADTAPLPPAATVAIFTEIVGACLALESALRVAFLGPEFTFSHLAVLARFGRQAVPVACASIPDAINAAAQGRAAVAMVPVENSSQGPVGETLDALVDTHLPVVGEYTLPIRHSLLGRGELAAVRMVYGHPQPLAQCRRWLAMNAPHVELIPAPSSATAAAQAAAAEDAAAIGPDQAGSAAGLEVLAANIQDDPANRTRFWLVGGERPGPTGKDKTSLVLTTPHRAGALHEALTPFRDYGLNMTMIHSRPARGRGWEYTFYVDFQGHEQDPDCAKALTALRELCPLLAVLGSYPEGS